MRQNKEISDILAEIAQLKEQLNQIYNEDKQINDKLLEVSVQLDRKINLYLKMNKKSQRLSGVKR